MTTVLIVDDQPDIVRLVRDYLERAGFRVLTAGDGEQALQVARSSHPDLVILDLSLPRLDGLDVARALRRDGDVPIIMLTARTEESDRVAGLELGADDYVTKPFSAREMVARVRAVLRRTSGARAEEDVVRVGESLDPRRPADGDDRRGPDASRSPPPSSSSCSTWPASRGGSSRGRSCSTPSTASPSSSYERAIDAHIKNIRRKIERDPRAPRLLQTVFGVGYRLSDVAR